MKKQPKFKQPDLPKDALKVALYARVSTTDQSCQMQLDELREYCNRRQWRITKEYVDTGISGTKTSRPALDQLMQAAQEHRFQCVLCWKLDRWGRSITHCIGTIQQLKSWQIRWISYTQNLDTDEKNPAANLLLYILAAVAEFEREMIRERVKSGITHAQVLGKHCGRPKIVFRRDHVRELREGGMTVRAISEALGLKRMTVYRALSA
jgi:DNA invertase Pin-like site-specific DNA recombinase